MTEFWDVVEPILVNLLIIAIGAVCTLCVHLIKKKVKEIENRIDSKIEKQALERADKVVNDCVSTVNQTYVENLKKEGKFTKENQKEAFDKTKKQVLAVMSEDMIEDLKFIFKNFDKWLETKIETSVFNLKK